MRTLCITLPLPERRLSPNYTVGSIGGRMAKAAAVKRYRHLAWATAMKAAGRGFEPMRAAAVELKFFYRDSRSRDKDNALASMKAAMDGIADAEIVINDADFTYLPVTMSVDRAQPRVEVHITEKATQ